MKLRGAAAMRNTRFEVQPTSGALGAELLGIDLAHPLDAEAVADIRLAFNEHGVIFFRDQRLTPEQHIAFAERIGTINITRFFKTASEARSAPRSYPTGAVMP
jgi:taurine dioxygenase